MTERDLFMAAVQIGDPAERAAYLDQACGGDTALRQRVDHLLQAFEQAGSFLQQPAAAGVSDPGLPAGTMIGPYKVLEQLGEGGFGVVYRAEQTQPVQRAVALKVLKPGMDSRQVVARFEAERQALAVMDHPNIAKVFDAGTTGAGLPYFVMELVTGEPVTDYCDRHHLTPRQRLELFVTVCQAVQHAHQKGIIHRDIKPSNVLVAEHDGTAVSKVIDFGVAKALGGDMTDVSITAGMIGTPLYMSPEQAGERHGDVDTRSDVYGLGVLLYELLTGTTPFTRERFKKAACDEIRRIIREEDPPKPSTRLTESKDALPSISAQRQTEPAKLTRLVRGELDWIVMKALEKDRDRRYESAAGFAQDLQRYLADEPVRACPPSARYRFQKFVRRNRGPVIAAGLLFLTLLGGVVGTTWGLVRANAAQQIARAAQDAAEAQRQRAQAAADDATRAKEAAEKSAAETKAVVDFLQNNVLAAARPKGEDGGLGREVGLRQAIDAAAPAVGTNFAAQPLIEAQLRLTLGTTYWYLGDAKTAAEQYRRAHDLFRQHRGPDHPETLRAAHNLAMSLSGLGRRDEALKLYEETYAVLKATLGPDHPTALTHASSLADSYHALGRRDEALRLQEDTLTRMRTTFGQDHPDTLMVMNNLGNTYAALGRLPEAVKLHEDTLAQMRARRGADHTDTLSAMMSLATTYGDLGRHDEALKLRQETLALRRTKLGPDHPETLKAMNNLAHSLAALGRHDEALKLRQETLALRTSRLGPDHPKTIESMHSVAASLMKLDRGTEAVPIIDECIRRSKTASVHPRLIPWAMELRLEHFEKARSAAGCRATAEMWDALNHTDAASLYTAACMRAVTAAAVRHDATTPAAEAERLAGEQADAAMAWLKKAIAAGFRDPARLKTDKSLDALRERDDFKALLAN